MLLKLRENFVEYASFFCCFNYQRQPCSQSSTGSDTTLFSFSLNSSFNSLESESTASSDWLPSSERLDNQPSLRQALTNSWLVQSRLFRPPSSDEASPPGGWERFLELWEPPALLHTITSSPVTTTTLSTSTTSATTTTTSTTATASTLLPTWPQNGPFYFNNPLTGDCPICLSPMTYDNSIPLHESTHPIHIRCLVGLLSADGRVGWSRSDFELACPSCRAHVRGSIMIHT